MSVWRIDDVCLNTNTANLRGLVDVINDNDRRSGCVALSVSITCPVCDGDDEMAFRRDWKPLSDLSVFYRMARCGVPEVRNLGCHIWSHGLLHVDHQRLTREAQELSIVLSCSILNTDVFVPPFHHWNDDTVSVCDKHGINLVRYEDGWSGCEHRQYDPSVEQWYLHPWRWTPEKLEAWLNGN